MPCELPAPVATPYLLHVGDLHERRNLAVVVDAVLEARRHFGALPALSLVMAGVDHGVGDALCNIAAEAVLRAPADGHTLLLAGTATLAINPALYPRLPFDAERDFTAIGMLAEYANVLLINPAKRDFPDLNALLDAARREPGQLSYASNGPGSVTHLTAERMAQSMLKA